jgi:BirA family biotin operon repressor/biotin-[acetyl-CoA-carboxylase] ligase
VPNPSAPLDATRVRAQLAGTRFADVRYVAQTASTNADAQLLLGEPGARGTTIAAEYQTAGVGRKGRRWFAPAGAALLFTTILPESVAASALWAVPFWIAAAVADAIHAHSGIIVELVWPNDLHLGRGKVGGILSVARISGDDAWVGCGVGLNVHRPVGDADLDALEPAPAFLDEFAATVEREALLVAILRAFERSFDDLLEPAMTAARWEERARLAGTVYRYRDDADGIEREGVAVRLGPRGALVIRDASGERTIDLADVRITGRATGPDYQRSSSPASTSPPPKP